MDASSYFRGKRITVMGLGLLGRGIGDAKYLADAGAELIITDLKSAEALAPSVAEFEGYSNVSFVLGEHRLEDFRDRDMILKAAGVPLQSPFVQEARQAGIPVVMSAALFASLAGIRIIGVTGTRGKSTVTYMLKEIWEAAGEKVLLGGNIRGVSNLALLPQVTGKEVAILELDSWQLQGFGNMKRSPNLSVFTTFYQDHMNYYHDSMDAYLADKVQIFLYQEPGDTLVMGSQCAPTLIEKYGSRMQGQTLVAGIETLPQEWELAVPGEHNRYNAGLALAAARSSGISDEVSKSALEGFTGVAGRLELIDMKNGVAFYNDSNSTTPEATIAALHALGHAGGKNVILIMGGADKGLPMEGLLKIIPETAKRVILLAGTGTDRIKGELPDAPVFDSLEAALAEGVGSAEPGDSLVLSPAFASFGMFTNEYDRGDQFSALVHAL